MPLEFWRVRLLRDYAKWSNSLRLASAGGGKGGGSTTSNTQQNQNVSYNPYAQPTIADIYNRAAYVSNTPYQPYNGQLVANLDPSQVSGIQSNSAYANYAQPFIGAGTQYTQDAANMVGNAYNMAGYGTNLLGAGANVAGMGIGNLGAGSNMIGTGAGMIGTGFGNMQSGTQAIATGQNMIGQGFQSVGTGQNMIGNSYNQFPTAEQMAAQAYNSLGYGQGMINQGYPTIGTAQNLVGQSYGGLGQGQGMIGAGMNLAYGGLPYVQGGAGGINAGQNALGLGINQAMGANPYVNSAAVLGLGGSNAVGSVGANDINQYLNPYLQTALGGTLANINQQNAIQQQQLLGNAAQQGALGGDRSAVAQAELARNQALAENQVIGQMENQGYQQAVQTALTQQQNQQANLARQLQASGQMGNLAAQKNIQGAVLGGLGQGLAGTGQQYAGLGMDVGQMGNLVGGLGTQYGNLAGLGANVGTQYGNLGALTGQLGSQYANIGGEAGQLAGMYGNLLGTQGGLGGQYGQLGGVAGQLGFDYAQTGTMLGNIGAQEAGAGSQMAGAGSQMANIGSQYGNLGSQIAGIGGQYGNLATQMGGLGGQYGGMGAQMANLGLQGQTAGLQGAQGQIGAGTLAQQTQQAQLTAAYQQYLQALAYPYQQSQFLANIGLPAAGAMGGYQTQIGTVGQVITPPGMSWGQAALGAGLLGAGLASDTGLFNSAPMTGTGLDSGFTGQVDPTTGNPIAARGGRIIHKDIGGPVSPSTTSLAADALFGGQAAQPNYASLLGINSGFNAPNFGFGSGNGGMGGFSPFMPPNIGGSSFSMPPASPIGMEHYVLNPGQSGELPGQTVMSSPPPPTSPPNRETNPLSSHEISGFLSRQSPSGTPQMTQMVDASGAPVQGAAPTPYLPSGWGNGIGGYSGAQIAAPGTRAYAFGQQQTNRNGGPPTGAIGQNQVTAPIPMQQPGTPYYIPPSISSYGVQNPLGTITPNQNQFMVGPSPINFAAASGGNGVAGGGMGGSGMMGGFSSPYGLFQTPSFSPMSFSQPANPFQQALQYFGPSLGSFNPYAGGNFSTAFSGAPSIQQANPMAPFSTSAMTGTQMVMGPNGIMTQSATPASNTGTTSPDAATQTAPSGAAQTAAAGNSFPQVIQRGGRIFPKADGGSLSSDDTSGLDDPFGLEAYDQQGFFYRGGHVMPPIKKDTGGSLMPWDVMVPNMTNPTSMTPNVMGSGVIPNMPIPNISVAMPKPLPSTGGITKSQQPGGSSLSQMMQLMKMGQSMKGLFGGSKIGASAGQDALLSGSGGDTLGGNALAPVATKIPSISGGAAGGADMGIGAQSGAGTLGMGAGPASIGAGNIGGVASEASGAQSMLGLSGNTAANMGLAGGATLADPAAMAGTGAGLAEGLTGAGDLSGAAASGVGGAAMDAATGIGTEAATAPIVAGEAAAGGITDAMAIGDVAAGAGAAAGIGKGVAPLLFLKRGGSVPRKADGGLISAPPTMALGDAPLLQQAFLLERQRKLQEALSQHAAPQGQGFADGGDVGLGINMTGNPGRHGVIPVGSPVRTPQVNYGHMIPLIPPMNPETATRNDNIYTTLLQSQATRDAMRNLRGAKRGGPIRGYDDGGDVPFPADDTFSAPDLPADAPAVEDTGQQDLPFLDTSKHGTEDMPMPEARPLMRDSVAPEAVNRLFQVESAGNPYAVTGSNRGLGQFGPQEERMYGINDANRTSPAAQANAVQREYSAMHPRLQSALGRDPLPGEFYLSHQQGMAGGPALLSANPDTPAWQAIRPFYNSDRIAKQAITGNIGRDAPFYGRPASEITAQEFRDYWVNKFDKGIPGTAPVTSDMMVAGNQPPMPYPRPQESSPYLDAGPPRQAPRQSMFSQVANALNPIGTAQAAETGQSAPSATGSQSDTPFADWLEKTLTGSSPVPQTQQQPPTVDQGEDVALPTPRPAGAPTQVASAGPTVPLPPSVNPVPKPGQAGYNAGPAGTRSGNFYRQVPTQNGSVISGTADVHQVPNMPNVPASSLPQSLPVQRQAPEINPNAIQLQQLRQLQQQAAQAQQASQKPGIGAMLRNMGIGILSANPARGTLGSIMGGAAAGVGNAYKESESAYEAQMKGGQQSFNNELAVQKLMGELENYKSENENRTSEQKYRERGEPHNVTVDGKPMIGIYHPDGTFTDLHGNQITPDEMITPGSVRESVTSQASKAHADAMSDPRYMGSQDPRERQKIENEYRVLRGLPPIGASGGTAPTQASPGSPTSALELPKDPSELIDGQAYRTPKGVLTWDAASQKFKG